MSCCNTLIVPFVNQASTIVPYTGNKPTVSVVYLIDGVWQVLGVATQMEFTDSQVTIYHGGLNTGAVKMVQ